MEINERVLNVTKNSLFALSLCHDEAHYLLITAKNVVIASLGIYNEQNYIAVVLYIYKKVGKNREYMCSFS